ncbi:MAG: hypothetical protein IPM15_01830 [Betaproteobacteria bacterium]|jgi:opacity protein-like surface antigen|nr:hypothetical protein [Betaproteobacteria bacterium]MCC6247414.1 hypothetical protein [Rubrivivax sp.]MCL4698073.1 hypothetical protein [Burkholderiaceae bacterium]
MIKNLRLPTRGRTRIRTAALLAAPIAALIGITAAPAVHAQVPQKRWSVSAFAQVSKYEDTEASGNVYASVGYLFTPSLEGEVRLSQTLGGSGEFTLLGGGAKYYFGGIAQAKAWLPYVHGSYNQTFGGGLDFKQYRAGGGIDLPLTEAASVNVEAAYVRQELDGPVSSKLNGTELVVGLKFRF